MSDSSSFTKLIPGFDFLQGLVKNAGAALPGIGQWVAPTIDPAEIEKRIEELRTVQFWLEQNARMIGATIQALEVQRMTLSTLKTMNVQMEGLRDSLQIRMPVPAAAPARSAPERAPAAAPEPAPAPAATAAATEPANKAAAESPAGSATAPGVVDPMLWWGALTKQFTELATTAMKDTGVDAARNLAAAMVKKSFGGADEAAETSDATAAKPAKPVKAAGNPTATGSVKKTASRRT